MAQDLLSYDSICTLIGRLILQHQFQTEQLGKSLTESQRDYNSSREEVARLRQEINRLKSQGTQNDNSGKRTDNQ